MDEVAKKTNVPVTQEMGKDGFRTADVTGFGNGGIRLPPVMKGKENL